MPHKNKEENNAYMRKYMLARYHSRREKAKDILGNKCSNCGAIELLEIDHIEFENKTIKLDKKWNIPWNKFLEELSKCQLLCRKCHEKKSIIDLKQIVKNKEYFLQHGGHRAYYIHKCRCVECVHYSEKYNQNRRQKRNKNL